MTQRSILAAASLVLAGSLAFAGCSGKVGTSTNGGNNASGGSSTGTDNPIAAITLPAEVGDNIGGLVNYNPYSPNPLTNSGYIYEPLMIQNSLNCTVTPWLATEYKWNDDKTLVFTIRDGVKWSDGQAFTADDVAFTFNLMKTYSGMDTASIWGDVWGGKATSVTASGNKVTLSFSAPAIAKFQDIVGLKILPKHLYEKVGDPTKYIDKAPVGTGAFKIGSYNGRKLVLQKRDDYWQADKIKVQSIVEQGNYDATQAALALNAGNLDAYWGEIPNPAVSFQAKNPSLNHFWYAPAGSTVLTPNDSKAPYSDPAFRMAITQGLDKEQMSQKATYGVMKVASQTGLKLPYAESLMPDKYKGQDTVIKFDTAKAAADLDTAGYKVGSDGFRTNKDGSPLKITFAVQAGWIDYQAAAQVIVNNLQAMKLNASLVAYSPDQVDAFKKQGQFDMMLEYLNGGCVVARNLGSKLATNQMPTKTTVQPNVQRYSDPATDKIINDLAATTDEAKQKELVGQLVDVMMTKAPVSTLFYAPARMIFRTDKAVGWPSEADPYATNADMLLIMTHLKSTK